MSEILSSLLVTAAEEARALGHGEVTPAHLLIALSRFADSPNLQKLDPAWSKAVADEFDSLGIAPRPFRRRLRALVPPGVPQVGGDVLLRSASCRRAFDEAKAAAAEEHVAVNGRHLIRALFRLLMEGSAAADASPERQDVPDAHKQESAQDKTGLSEIGRRLRVLRRELLSTVIGQDHAIAGFVSGLFNVEVLRGSDSEKRRPEGLFVFAGPPGVGKTFLAESGARHLDRPFRRFDMSGYSQDHEISGLVGSPSIYKGAQPGELTGFVKEHPNAIVLFDEIEKAHPNVILLFLQLLDAGRLQDKFSDEMVEFSGSIVILTTNAGSRLYDNPNASGIHSSNDAFHRNTVIDALRVETDARRGQPIFPAAICSRLATGYPLLFNHLGIEDLSRIASAEMSRICALLEQRHGQKYGFAQELPLALVMREGAGTDARRVKAQAEAFLKEEVFKISALFSDDADLARVEEVSFVLDDTLKDDVAERYFRQWSTPKVIVVGSRDITNLVANVKPERIAWETASDEDRALDILTRSNVDLVLLDLDLKRQLANGASWEHGFQDVSGVGDTVMAFRSPPVSARRFMAGQRVLEHLRARMPMVPVYILAPIDAARPAVDMPNVDDDALLAVVRAGGARGIIRTHWEDDDEWGAQIEGVVGRLRRERMALELARKNEVLAFDTAPALRGGGRQLCVRLRNFRTVRTPRSEDTRGLLADMERPATRFDDVVGAAGAKEALIAIRDWLRSPSQFAAMGIEAPRGILLTGAPGTGKTMLARALAGESDCAFIVEAATSFVTMWQGSGPESVRSVFQRARRYAPCVLFIDEIDAVGRKRGGSAGAHGEEMALNALLTEMDGFASRPSEAVIVLAATNLTELLDPALKRRFAREIEVELPTREDRKGYLERKLSAKAANRVSVATIERIAAQSHGMSIAYLERILAQASMLAFKSGGDVTDEHLAEAFELVAHGVARPNFDALRTARHEAGHALLMCLLGRPPVYATIIGRGSFGGYVAPDVAEERDVETKVSLEDRICQVLGGREAERLCYGDGAGDSTGPASDLDLATRIADAMVCRYGMSPELGFVRIAEDRPLPTALEEKRYLAVRRIIDEQSVRARKLLVEHRAQLECIAEALVRRGRLLRDELLDAIRHEHE